MSDESTKHFIEAYYQEPESPTPFFTGMFQSPPRNFFKSESIEFDIIRSEKDVAVAVQDLSNGYRNNASTIYTNKEFVPPIFKEKFGLNGTDLIKRFPGRNPFESPRGRADLVDWAMMNMRKVQRKIQRANELQASQVMQTGTASLIDANGNEIYGIDYKPKATHFPTTSVSWQSATDVQIIDDLEALCRVINTDGLSKPVAAFLGSEAMRAIEDNADMRDRLNTRRIDLGAVNMNVTMGDGSEYRGTLQVGSFKLDLYTYAGFYEDIEGGGVFDYLSPKKVIVTAANRRADACFGNIPHLGDALGMTGQNILPELPRRFGNSGQAVDLHTNVWMNESRDQLFVGIGSRPIYIPTAIDQYGCLTAIL